MRLLLDANLSATLAVTLTKAGHDTNHVADVGLLHASDDAIFDYAAEHGQVVVTADTDFPIMLALRRVAAPSVVLLRHVTELPRQEHGALLIANLPQVRDELDRGAIVSLSPTRLAVRTLPIE
jgi:predicted nuclease of predicted toxin-antitoxin system